MSKLVYSAIASLDGYVADERGDFGWAAPDEEVHRFVNDRERPIGTYLYGRRMYETMRYWETVPLDEGSEVTRDYTEIWRAAEKVVFSRTLEDVDTAKTRLTSQFDPAAIRAMKAGASRDISVGGPELAAEALRAALVDEIHVLTVPTVVGGGNPALPDGLRLELDLLDEHRFGNGTVFLRYRVAA